MVDKTSHSYQLSLKGITMTLINKTINNRRHSLKDLFPELTDKQLLVFEYYSLGHNAKEIQAICGCSRTAIEKNLSNIKYQLNCNSANELKMLYFIRVLDNIHNILLSKQQK